MDNWKRILSILLIPLNLSGLMLLLESRARMISSEMRWRLLLVGMALCIPGAMSLILTLPLRREGGQEDDEDDELEELSSAEAGIWAISPAEVEGRGERPDPARLEGPQAGN
jgi:hypothetical protein